MITRCCASAAAILLLCEAAQSDVLSHWRFDEAGGSVAADSVGDADGALAGGASFAPAAGIAGGAIDLDRTTGDLVNFGDVHAFTGDASCTVALWVRTTTISVDTIALGRHLAGSLNGYMVILNENFCFGAPGKVTAYFSAGCGQEATSVTTVTDGEWHHLVMTHSTSGGVRVFIDGDLEDIGSVTSIETKAPALLLGGVVVGNTPTALFTGLIDDLQVYDNAASDAQVQSLFEHPGQALPPCPADLVDDGIVNIADLLAVLGGWETPDGDVTGDGTTDVLDLLGLLALWGPCPLIE